MKRKVLVLGATGNTGAYLTEYLVERLSGAKWEVVAAGRRSTDFFDRYGIDYVQVDISDARTFESLPDEGVYGIVFLAGLLPAYMDGYHPEDYIRTNSLGALNVFEYARRVGADRVLYAQTISDVLGAVTPEHPLIHPDDARNIIMTGDHAVYALSKCLAVDLLRHYRAEYGIKDFVFRLPTVYAYTPDKYWHVNGERRILGYRLIMDRAMAGMPLEVWGDPKRSKDVVYVRDFCQLLYKALVADGVDGGMYNVGTGVGTTTEDQIKGIAEVFSPKGRECEIVYRPEKPSGPSYLMDIGNARSELGYEPEYMYLDYLADFKREMALNRFADLRG